MTKAVTRDNVLLFVENQGGLTSWEALAAYFETSVSEVRKIFDANTLAAVQKDRRKKHAGLIPLIFSQAQFEEC